MPGTFGWVIVSEPADLFDTKVLVTFLAAAALVGCT